MKQATDNNEKLSSICGDETIGKKVVFDAVGVFVEEVFMLMKWHILTYADNGLQN